MAGLSVIRHRWNAVFTRAPPVGFKLETNGFQFYAIANLDNIYMTHCKYDIDFAIITILRMTIILI